MNDNVRSMIGKPIQSIDGDLGKVNGFFFDIETWTMRYLIVETGDWMADCKVLISLASLDLPAMASGKFLIDITRSQVLSSPKIILEKLIARQQEIALLAHYGWPHYWITAVEDKGMAIREEHLQNLQPLKGIIPGKNDNPLLRSTSQITGYHILTDEDEFGHVEDFIVDIENWKLRFLYIDTGNWLPMRKVLIPPVWIERIDWSEKTVHLHRAYKSSDLIPDFERRKQPINFPQEATSIIGQ